MQDDKPEGLSPSDEDKLYASVPADFPRPEYFGAVAGTQPKFLAEKYKGRFYSPGCTPPEIYERWHQCENIAQQLREKSLESKAGKRSHMSEVEILDQYLDRLQKTGWVSEPEGRWTIRRSAELLGWPIPDALEH